MAWFNVFKLGVIVKWPAKLAAPIMVLFVDRKTHPVWGVSDATDLSYWNIGFRNAAHNLLNKPTPNFTTKSNTRDHTLEKQRGFQWRLRKSDDEEYVSFRCTWGEPRKQKGKYEFYIGWTMNEGKTMRLTFFQLRMKWQSWLLAALIASALVAVSGCAPYVGYTHVSQPNVRHDGIDLICGGGEAEEGRFRGDIAVCQNVSSYGGTYFKIEGRILLGK